MADARFPERWLTDRRIMRLSPPAFRLYVLTLAYSVSNRTDGDLDREDLALIGCNEQHAPELTKAGLWLPREGGWHVIDYGPTQTTRAEFEVLENARRRERLKKQKQRSTRPTDESSSTHVPGDSPEGTSPGDSTGKARQGKASASASARRSEDGTNSENGWPPRALPGGCPACGHPLRQGELCECDPLASIA